MIPVTCFVPLYNPIPTDRYYPRALPPCVPITLTPDSIYRLLLLIPLPVVACRWNPGAFIVDGGGAVPVTVQYSWWLPERYLLGEEDLRFTVNTHTPGRWPGVVEDPTCRLPLWVTNDYYHPLPCTTTLERSGGARTG